MFDVGGGGTMVVMSSLAPRRTCPHCKRDIAAVSGRFARQDPVDSGPTLLSRNGSLQQAPVWDLLDRVRPD